LDEPVSLNRRAAGADETIRGVQQAPPAYILLSRPPVNSNCRINLAAWLVARQLPQIMRRERENQPVLFARFHCTAFESGIEPAKGV
jgi:hypothetical protein